MEIIKIKTDGLAHLSYMIIDQNQAAVIDPRRDCEVYLNIAQEKEVNIEYIFETHRHEDFICGSRELARYTGCSIFHGNGLDFKFGRLATDGDTFSVGNARLEVLNTPGHTPESISLALYPVKDAKEPSGVFTGDALFVGDVGRTDFFEGEEPTYAEMLFNSIHKKILPLGDQAILYPAHGSGSVCGDNISDREDSTLGYERKNNPLLSLNKDAFIKTKVEENHQYPDYFERMEIINLKGSDAPLENYHQLRGFNPEEFKTQMKGSQVVDIRETESYLGGHIPKSINLPNDFIASYAGYLLDLDEDIVFISDSVEQRNEALKNLQRLGFDRVVGYLQGGVDAWKVAGHRVKQIPLASTDDKKERQNLFIDIRKPNEWEEGIIKGARTLYLGDLKDNIKEFGPNQIVIPYCASGKRATIAASLFEKHGFENIKVSWKN